jgi:hypothetical protein
VGNNGETLVADSSTSTGLRYQSLFGANKNKMLNADFYINQRGFTSSTATGGFVFDRWQQNNVDGTVTFSAETFTPGAAPVAGYEAANYPRIVTTGQTATNALAILTQKMEDVRTFAGQTITVSFWAQAGSGTPSIAIELDQQFGSGGSTRVTTFVAKTAITTSWVRYSATVAVPSISGKTIGTSSFLSLGLWVSAGTDFNARTSSLGIQSNTFNIWGVQVEAGSVATAFQTATGTIQGELAACQRYYYQNSATNNQYTRFGNGITVSTSVAHAAVKMPVTMRTAPSLVTTATASNYVIYTGSNFTLTSVPAIDQTTPDLVVLTCTTSATQTINAANYLAANASTAALLGFNAEL